MKKINFVPIFVLIILIFPILLVSIYSVSTAKFYDLSYLGAMADKYDRLNFIDKPKIILIGGSSMAFGVDSSVLERELDMEVVNLSLYAAVGNKATLELSQANINKNDIIVFAPEMDKQAYSLYFDPLTTLQMLDSKRSMFYNFSIEEQIQLFANLPKYFSDRRKHEKNGKPNPTNAYSRKAFNKYGDNIYERPLNIMAGGYLKSNMIDISTDIISSDFIEFLNKYIDYANDRKAKVYFSFPPMNKLAIKKNSDFITRLNMYRYLREKINCPVIR